MVVSNHNSHLDAAILMTIVSVCRRLPQVHPGRGRGLLRQVLAACALMGDADDERHSDRAKARPPGGPGPAGSRSHERLRNGESLIFFPEGSRGEAGVVARFRPGVGRLVRAVPGLLVVPVFMSGPERIWPRGNVVPVPMSIDVHVGKPRTYSADEDAKVIANLVRDDVMALAPPPPPEPGRKSRPPIRVAVCGIDEERNGAVFWEATRGLGQIDRWLHSFSAGVDNVFFRRLLERGVRVTTSSGAHAVPIAQTAILYLLALSRDLPGWLEDQRQRVWKPRMIGDLQGQVLGVVGLGPIGLEVARLGAALRMRVIGVRRRPRGDEPCETWALSELPKLFALADCLVLALPLTDDTRHLIDATALGTMKRSAVLVNVGRGELVDEAALTTALQTGSLGGAGLDVFEVEPLPPTSPLWEVPNVIITPHSSGSHSGIFHRASEIFIDNLRHYVRGELLRNEVPARVSAETR